MWFLTICVLLVIGSVGGAIGAGAGDASDRPAPVASAAAPFVPAGNEGTFLTLSDIHFDPYADPAVVRQLATAPVDQWGAILAGSTAPFAEYGSDTTYPLMMSALSAARGTGLAYDYVLVTGDLLAHDFRRGFETHAGGDDDAYGSFVVKTITFLTRTLQQTFAGVPVILALGNNDSACGDYRLTPNGAMLHALAPELNVLAGHPQATEDFEAGGFYAVPHPTVPGRQIVVLNDVFWSTQYLDRCDPMISDAGAAELGWLEWKLFKARSAKQSVTLVMHIPPGIDAYRSAQHRERDCRASVTSACLSCGSGNSLASSNLRSMRRMAQKRLTAVGRVAPMVSQICSKSRRSSERWSASESRTPSAMPIAAATPIAGAPRTVILRIASATSS